MKRIQTGGDTNTDEFIKPETESPTQDEAESGAGNTRTYPTEGEYCQVNVLGEDSTRDGFIVKFGTNNDDELFGTPSKDLILGLDGNDIIYGLEGGDIICGGKGNDVSYGDSSSSSYDKIPKSENSNMTKGSEDLIFGQEGKDSIYGGAGNDLIQGGIDDDTLYGHNGISHGEFHNDGNDIMDGGPDYDSCLSNLLTQIGTRCYIYPQTVTESGWSCKTNKIINI